MRRIEDVLDLTPSDLSRDYLELGSLRKIAVKYGVSHHAVKDACVRLGVQYKSKNWFRLPLNEAFFSDYSDRMFYWVGFLAADGCIHNNFIKLSLAEKDRPHLILFKKDLGFAGKMTKVIAKNSNRNPLWKDSVCFSVSVCSAQMVYDLAKYGIVERKSKILTFPKVPEMYLRSYCLGYFDGDGCWALHAPKSRPNRRPQLMFSVRGTNDFLSGLNRAVVLGANLPNECLEKSLSYSGGTYTLQYVGNRRCRQIGKWLYSGPCKSYLKRKHSIYKEALRRMVG